MISGRFGEIGELFFDIYLVGADGEQFPIEVLLDTGFLTGWLAFDIQDIEILGWNVIERDRVMQMARGKDSFDIYEGKVVVDGQEYIIPVLTGDGIPETILGLQWLRMLPLAVNFEASILTLG